MDKLELMLEADRRGLLPPDKKAMLDEARARGLVPAGESSDPIKAAIDKSPTAGVLDAGLALASGAVAAPVAGIAGLVRGAHNVMAPITGDKEGAPAGDVVRKVQDAMTYQPRTKIGEGITKAVSYPFEKLADVADAAGAKTTDVTGSPAAGAGLNTAFQAVPMVLGRVKPAAGALEKPKPKPLASAAETAREADIAIPPSQANPTIWNKIVEGFGGKIKTAQDLSLKNQPKYNGMIREGLGLEAEAPLTPQTLSAVRKEAGQSYDAVRSSGRVSTDFAYAEALDKVAAPFERAAKDFPDAARTDVLDAVKAARRGSFDASSAVDQIGILRDKADAAYAASDKKLGKAYKDVALAMEEQLGRHLDALATSNEYGGVQVAPEAIKAFRDARERIAKTYTVEKHLTPDGNVNMQGLAADLKRGKYMSGDIKQAAQLAQTFPKTAQLPEKVGGVPQSPLDHAFAGSTLIGSIVSGHPMLALGAALPYTRPLVRKIIGSDAYQDTFAKPGNGPSVLTRAQRIIGDTQRSAFLPEAEVAEGQRQ